MRILLIGASGTIGSAASSALRGAGHEVVEASRTTGADLTSRDSLRELFQRVGQVDAVALAAGHVAFKPLLALTDADLLASFSSKLAGQIRVVQEGLPFVRDGGSFVLISGVTAREPIRDGSLASVVARGLEGFAMAAASELPRGIRINVVSPTVLEESAADYAAYFAGEIPVSSARVGAAYLKAVSGRMNGVVLIP